jgi:hypothetical protein
MFRNAKGKMLLRTTLVLISFKTVFCIRLSGPEMHDAHVEWRLQLAEIKKTLVKDTSVLVVTRQREELREIKMMTKEEAFLVYTKLTKSMVDRSIEAYTPSKSLNQSTLNLVQRSVSKAKKVESLEKKAVEGARRKLHDWTAKGEEH